MKSVFYIILLTLLFSLSTFSQERVHSGVLPDKPTAEKLREIHKPNVDGLQGLYDIESILLKSKNSDRQTVLRNPQIEFYEAEGFNARDTRATINRTILGNGFLLIEGIEQTWIGIINYWLNDHKYSYTYDGNNNLTELLYQGWDGVVSWVNYNTSSYTYDGNNNLAEELRLEWEDSVWVNNLKKSYAYDGNNNQTEFLYQSWDGSAWMNDYKYSSTYDGNNNRTEWLYQYWDGSIWVNYRKSSFIYDVNNNLTENLGQSWDDSSWVNDYKYSYAYDGNNNLTENLYKLWNVSSWVNVSKYSNTYDVNNNLTEHLGQSWDGSAWVNSSKGLNTYDGNNNLTEGLHQAWNGFTWVNYRKSSYTYDVNNNLAEWLYQTWNGSIWENYQKYLCAYVPVTAVNEDLCSVNSYSLSNNYPNPFNPSTKITYSILKRSNVSLIVFDLLGSEVVKLVNGEIEAGSYDISFNASNLPSGVYFYRLQAGSFVQTRKMILLK